MIGKQEGEEGELAAAPEEPLLVAQLVAGTSLTRASSAGQREVDSSSVGRRTLRPSSSRPSASASRGQLVQDARRLVRRRRPPPRRRAGSGSRSPSAAPVSSAGAPMRDDLPLAQDGDAVGELLGLVEVVRGQQDRLAERAQRADHLPGGPARGRVEAGRRLVEEEDLGVADQAEAEVEPPLLAAGERPHRASRFSSRPTSSITSSASRGLAVVAGEEREALPRRSGSGTSRTTGGRRRCARATRSRRAAGPRRARRPSRRRAAVALEDLDGRRLAGAVRAEQAEDLARLDLEVDPAQRLVRPVRLPQAADGDGRHQSSSTARPAGGNGGGSAAGELGGDQPAVGLVADDDDLVAASGDRRADEFGGRAGREPLVGLRLAPERARDLGAVSRARRSGLEMTAVGADAVAREALAERAGVGAPSAVSGRRSSGSPPAACACRTR